LRQKPLWRRRREIRLKEQDLPVLDSVEKELEIRLWK